MKTYYYEDFDAAAWCEQLIRSIPRLSIERQEAFLALSLHDQIVGIGTMAIAAGDTEIRDQAAMLLTEMEARANWKR